MKKTIAVAVAIAAITIASNVSAADATGTLAVTGTVESSIFLTIESAGGTTSGMGTAAASTDLGTIAKYGTSAPTGFTLTRGASNWTLSSTVGVRVVKANLTSTDYTLGAELQSAPASGIVWKLNGSTLPKGASPATLTSTGTYASTASYSWDIVVADSAAAAAIDNTILFSASSN